MTRHVTAVLERSVEAHPGQPRFLIEAGWDEMSFGRQREAFGRMQAWLPRALEELILVPAERRLHEVSDLELSRAFPPDVMA